MGELYCTKDMSHHALRFRCPRFARSKLSTGENRYFCFLASRLVNSLRLWWLHSRSGNEQGVFSGHLGGVEAVYLYLVRVRERVLFLAVAN
jgi:hypothetical protein